MILMALTYPLFEPLNAEKILPVVTIDNHFKLAKLEIFEIISSTNQYLLEHAKTGPSGWVCLAEQQTAGRGRHGRAWFSPYGAGIICSILWRFSMELSDIAGLSMAVGVMVMRALNKYGVQAGIQLKWPNDILFAARKLVGILLERHGESVVIGIGINVGLPPPVEVTRIDLTEIMGQPVARNNLVGLLLNELLENLPLYSKKGLTAFIDEWRQHDFLAGKEVIVYTSEASIIGWAQGINEQGELLVLDKSQRLQQFCYGEVSVRQLLP
jgi:BirA family biotin operon repressor/biotin-[acetyl-CoA-carboxylase] ligase